MKVELSTVFLGILSSAVTAWVSYYFTKRSNENKIILEKRYEQKFKYFFPFKNECIEFKHRVKHIARDLLGYRGEDEKKKAFNSLKMKKHFSDGSNLSSTKKDWFVVDFYSREEGRVEPGGYFFASTLYMHCLLFRQINILQKEYPFISVELNKYKPVDSQQVKEEELLFKNMCKEIESMNETGYGFRNKLKEIKAKGNTQSTNTLIEAVRLSTVFSGGLPYNMHNSFGAYITKGDKMITYEEFCKEISNEDSQVKFLPLIRFWQKLGSEDPYEYKCAVTSLFALYVGLEQIEFCYLV